MTVKRMTKSPREKDGSLLVLAWIDVSAMQKQGGEMGKGLQKIAKLEAVSFSAI